MRRVAVTSSERRPRRTTVASSIPKVGDDQSPTPVGVHGQAQRPVRQLVASEQASAVTATIGRFVARGATSSRYASARRPETHEGVQCSADFLREMLRSAMRILLKK